MNQPLVCCVCLTADRPAMVKRAVACFEAQTYKRKALLILDTGSVPSLPYSDQRCHVNAPEFRGETIGSLRNRANDLAVSYVLSRHRDTDTALFAHWDDDDWSHPNRLAEQVALIVCPRCFGRGESTLGPLGVQSCPDCKGGAEPLDAVGYSDMLFLDQFHMRPDGTVYYARCMKCGETLGPPTNVKECYCGGKTTPAPGEAWLYTSTSSYMLGTSLLYRRAAWERKPFEHVNQGEDRRWLAGLRTMGDTSLRSWKGSFSHGLMIASIHGANTSSRIDPASENFRRVPEWDAHCRQVMAL